MIEISVSSVISCSIFACFLAGVALPGQHVLCNDAIVLCSISQ